MSPQAALAEKVRSFIREAREQRQMASYELDFGKTSAARRHLRIAAKLERKASELHTSAR
jgi:hypothetical protein